MRTPPSPDPSAKVVPRRAGGGASRVVLAGAALLVVIGWAGLDRWFYENVSCVLNTEEVRPLQHCFYSLTKPFWLACRLAFGHVIGGAVIYGLIAARHPRRWTAATLGLVVVVTAALLANVLQGAIGRLRPNRADSHLAFTRPVVGVFERAAVSFPSGEAATAFALAYVLTRLFPRWQWAFLTLAVLTAGARLVNGAHYLSDVAAGAIVGEVTAWALLRWTRHHWWALPAP